MRYLIVVLLLLSAPIQAKTTATEDPFAIILSTLSDCYEKAEVIDPNIAKCCLKKMQKYPNPDGYRVNIAYDSFDRQKPINVTLTIFNKYGEIFICKGLAQQRIVFEECIAEKKDKMSKDQEISIVPP